VTDARRSSDVPTSPKSDRVRKVRGLDRRASRIENGLFRAEGPQAVREALKNPQYGRVETLYVTEECLDRYPEFHTREIAGSMVGAEVLAAMSEAVAPQGILAICRLPQMQLADVASRPRLVAIAVDVRDPGNLGTIIRSADAAGADLVVATGNCVDPWAPKTVRSSAGSLWHLPVVVEPSLEKVLTWAREAGLQILAADGAAKLTIDDPEVELAAPTAWLLGNEAWGLLDESADLADHRVALPIYGAAESLNVAVAASLLMYASARAQRTPDPAH
jgi:RNA methyltransferase, TrmH family